MVVSHTWKWNPNTLNPLQYTFTTSHPDTAPEDLHKRRHVDPSYSCQLWFYILSWLKLRRHRTNTGEKSKFVLTTELSVEHAPLMNFVLQW